jgi:two-component system, NtrC family, sensor kinase
MKLRTKVIALLGALFAVLAVAQLGVQQRILLPSFAAIERQDAQKDMLRVAHTIDREIDLLSITAADNGNWAETYQFMQDRNPQFVVTNLSDDAIDIMRVNVVAFIAPDGRYAWATSRNQDTGESLDIDLVRRGALPEDHPWRDAVRRGAARSGLLRTEKGAMLAALCPILDGKGGGPPRGMLMLGRLLDDAELARIGQQAQVEVAAIAPLPAGSPAEPPAGSVVQREGLTEVARTFRDVTDAPLLRLRVAIPRTITAQGNQTLRYASLFLVGSGVVVLALLIAMLNSTVLRPLATLTTHAVAIGRDDNLGMRLGMDRSDEIGQLAGEFDRMVESLGDVRRQLVDRSFEAGIAENASGVLHNLGNAITPLGVQIAALQQRLHSAPAGDLELVLAELRSGTADPGRRNDLEQFLQLAAEELVRNVTDAQLEIAAAAGQAQAIEEILVAQSRSARAERVVEVVALPDLVQQALGLVDPQLRQRLTLALEPALREMGPLCLARTALKQVFQNLIINAAESVRDAGRERGTLRIDARLERTPAGERLHLSFADDGAGIDPANLGRIFENGFSTKSPNTNSGVGLHWSANTIAALGGLIRADSAGAGRGARFEVDLPVQRPVASELANVA